MDIRIVVVLAGTLLSLLSCSKPEDDKDGIYQPAVTVYKLTSPKYVFGFGTQRYSYCPSALGQDNGDVHLWFCGNPTNGVMVDNVYHIYEGADGNISAPKSVLQPGLSWDSHHTCDPCVVEGRFLYESVTYRYAMFYLSNPNGYYYNEIGVAFSNELDADSWIKYPEQIVRKTWNYEGDQDLGNAKSWGVGQPSAFSLDKKGKLILTYTIGDVGGTRIVWRECDFGDMSEPKLGAVHTVQLDGLKSVSNSAETYLCNADFAVNIGQDKIVMIRPVHPHPDDYPSYLPVASEIDYMDYSAFCNGTGTWTALYRIRNVDSGFPRNHNACLLRDNFGHIEDWETPTCYFTVSKAAPDVSATPDGHAEWTYHIYKASVTKKVIER